MTYPLPFREKVFATKDKLDLTFEQTSQRFDIPIRTLFRWQQKIAPCLTRDKPATKIDMDALAQHVDDYPDAYLHERAAVFGVTFQAIHCALKRLGISDKKTQQHPKANEEARIAFKEKIAAYENEGKTIIYIDESGFAHDMPRTHGYSAKGKRCYGIHNWNAKGRTNVIGAIINFTFLTLGMFESTINSDVFYAWLTQD